MKNNEWQGDSYGWSEGADDNWREYEPRVVVQEPGLRTRKDEADEGTFCFSLVIMFGQNPESVV